MDNPLISILICCHNRRRYLEQTMGSVFAQHYRPVEIIVLDDGSTDGTTELVAHYGDSVKYHWQPQQGIAAARNAACQLAKGEFIAFQDDDDLMAPDRIVHLYEALRRWPSAIFATGGYAFIDADGNLTGKRHLPPPPDEEGASLLIEDAYTAVLWPRIPLNPHTSLFRKSDGEKVGWFDTEFRYASEDKDFFARLARLGPVVYVREVVSFYRRGHTSISSNDFRAMFSRLQLLQKHLGLVDSENQTLRRRLQLRMLNTLKRIASYQSRGLAIDDPTLERYVENGFSMLGIKERLSYKWYTSIRLPVRNLVRRSC